MLFLSQSSSSLQENLASVNENEGGWKGYQYPTDSYLREKGAPMVLQSQSSSSIHENLASVNEKEEGWNGYEYPTDSNLSSMQQSKESFCTFSEGTRSTQFDEGSSVYSDEYSRVSDPPKKTEPTTIIVLHHQIAHVDSRIEETQELASRKEKETERAELVEKKREARSFTRLRKRFSWKKKANPQDSSDVHPPAKVTESKSSLQAKGSLNLPRRGSKYSLKEKQNSSMPQKDVVSSRESGKDDNDESTDGGSLNTYDPVLMNARDTSTLHKSTPDDSQVDGSMKSHHPSKSVVGEGGQDSEHASVVPPAVTTDTPRGQSDEGCVGKTVDDDKSIKSTKSIHSIKSSRSSMSIRSLSSILNRKRSGRHSGKSKSLGSAPGTSGDRKAKKKRSWIPKRRRRTPKTTVARPLRRPAKGILRKPGAGTSRSGLPREDDVEKSLGWELLLDRCDGFFCIPIFGDEADLMDSDESHTPSEIYINSESSKTLVTV